jgi:hypothetical protein
MGHDAEILDAKLDVEKTLCLQCAERTGLLHPDGASQFQTKATAQAVEKVLDTMHRLDNSSGIKARYGLRKPESLEPLAAAATTISCRRMGQFMQEFDRLKIRKYRSDINTAWYSPPVAKIRWVAVDKEKFERLIQDLSYFVGKLNELLPPVGNILSSMATEDIEMLHDSGNLRKLLSLGFSHSQCSESRLMDAARVHFEGFCREQILSALWFRKTDDRRSFLSPAHSQTLRSGLERLATGQYHTGISEWLRSGSGTFW